MKYKKIMIMLIMAIFLASIAGVCAADANDTTVASDDTNQIELSNSDKVIEDNLQTSEENDGLTLTDNDVFDADSATYSDLDSEIRASGNVTLTHKNYIYDDGATAITITEDNKVIDGNGAVIDMAESTIRAFTVSASGVTIKNVTIKNANYNGDGGAIYFSSSGTVTNCNFTNNKASGDGGAVYFRSTGTVTNCNFTNNSAGEGGAIWIYYGSVENCNFTNNSATYNGGAIWIYYGSVENCNFIDNQATGTDSCGGAILFAGTGNVTNCNFTNNTAYYGGAVCFNNQGNVTNCNFTNNSATCNGGAIWMYSGTVSNCNFTDNEAYVGGAVYFNKNGEVTNCNFTGNHASYGGAVYFLNTGEVTNCNFTNNKASGYGGAINMDSGTVTNCNFTDNSASAKGGAIYSCYWSTADTCIFKTSSDTTFNIGILPPTLNVDNFTTFYGSGEKLTFNLTTDSGMPVTNGNISISVYFKDNNTWVGNYSCLSGEGWTISLPVGSYYANFTTEYAGFEAISRTIKIIPNIPYYVNVTPVTTNNRTVNITAKSNIPQDIMEGKLLFILPNGANITANYAGNGTWWAEHTFDAYDVYQVNVTYVGLDNVTVNNGTISISKTPTNITVVNTTVNLFVLDSVATGAALTPADAGNLTFTSSNYSVAKVENGYIIAVGGGTAIITVSFAGSEDYAAAENKTITVNVIKYDSKVTISQINDTDYPNNVTVEYSIENRTNVSITIDGVPQDKIIITNDTITVIGLDAGEYTITIINNESDLYYKSNDTKTFTVNPLSTSIAASDISTTYNINKDLVITLKDSKGEALSGVKVTVNLKGTKTYTTDKNGQIKINVAKLVPKVYTAKVTFDGNTNYAKSTADVKVTVKKAKPKIIAKKKTYKAKKKTKKFTITLKDNKGKPIKKVKVRLIVQKIKKTSKNKNKKSKKNKRKNIVKTNKKGKATFKINRYKKGKYLATVKFYGNKYYAKTVKKVKINLK